MLECNEIRNGETMDTQRIRESIPVTRNTIYMNTGWSGPSPAQVTRRIQDQIEMEMNQGPATVDTMPRNRAVRDEVTNAIAGLLNAPPDTVALTQRTTHGQTLVLNGMDWHQGDELVTCSLEHPSVMVPSLILQETHGVKVRVADIAPLDDRETILSKLEAMISPSTRLVFLSHIQFTCGLRLPIREIADLAHQRGAYLLVDGAQGGGQVALDMDALDCDAYALPGQKWLLGPEGTGALYVRKELLPEITPRYPASGAVSGHSWEDGTVTLTPDAAGKFASSTPSIALLAGMAEAIAFHQEAGGSAEVEARTMQLADAMKGMLSRISGITLTCPLDPEMSSGLVTFAIEGWEPAKMVEALWEKGIAGRQVSDPAAVRLCTAFFNTEDEIEQVGRALMDITGK